MKKEPLGYSWHKKNRKWLARKKVNGKTLFLGQYTTPGQAREAYVNFCEERRLIMKIGDKVVLNEKALKIRTNDMINRKGTVVDFNKDSVFVQWDVPNSVCKFCKAKNKDIETWTERNEWLVTANK